MSVFNVFRRPLTVRRPIFDDDEPILAGDGGVQVQNGTFYDDAGLALPVIGAELIILASVQPASGKVMQSLPENRRDIETYSLFSDYALETGDIVEIKGNEYEVRALEAWENNVINHNQYIAQRIMG
jgi:hypothetical protein